MFFNIFSNLTNVMNNQDKKKHKDHSDQPMQYSKFLKGVYDSSDEDEVTVDFLMHSLILDTEQTGLQGTRRSAISGQKIKMKVDRTSQDKALVGPALFLPSLLSIPSALCTA